MLFIFVEGVCNEVIEEIVCANELIPIEVWMRIDADNEYIKLLIDKQTGIIIGACIIINQANKRSAESNNEVDLEETFESLMRNKINVLKLGRMSILNPDIDIEDFFD